jgi:hypothetical protein
VSWHRFEPDGMVQSDSIPVYRTDEKDGMNQPDPVDQPDPVAETLEQLAELTDDPSAEILDRYASACPESEALMHHMDVHMKGRMMADVLTLLLTEPDQVDQGYLHFEVVSHRNYGVGVDLFPDLLYCVRDWVRDRLGPAWTHAAEQAWRQRIDDHLANIRAVAAN